MNLSFSSVQCELLTYIIVWCSSVLYSIYCFTKNCNKHFQFYNDEYSDFASGWNFLSRKKDVSDYEWETIKFLIEKLYTWFIVTVTASEMLRTFGLIKILQLWQIGVTGIFITKELGFFSLIMILFQPLIFTIAYSKRKKLVIWICNGFVLILLSLYKYYSAKEEFLLVMKLTDKEVYSIILAFFWTNLRCVSYYLDLLDKSESFDFLGFLSYVLYFQTFFCGPFIQYRDFKYCQQLNHEFLVSRMCTLFLQICRFLFWLIFVEFCLHYIYVNAAAFDPEWIASLDSWSLYGYGYTMGQFFHMKYLVVYGLATSFARFENIKVPSLPVCIGRIHLYSDMWKYFDVGFYNFLIRYIYLPSIRSGLIGSRLLSSLLCFIFVYVWHGTENYIMVWAILNYTAIVVENVGQWINEKYLQRSKLCNKLGYNWFRRISCLAASPLLAISAISNFYFFARLDIGIIFTHRFLSDSFITKLALIGILYCCCQVSTEIRPKKKKAEKLLLLDDKHVKI